MRNSADVTGDKPIAISSQSISGRTMVISRLLQHPWKKGKDAILFCFGHHTLLKIENE
jgi:hypothetical protein